MKRYTEVELSRILGEHVVGLLVRAGRRSWDNYRRWDREPRGCANQVAYNDPSPHAAGKRNAYLSHVFDDHYDSRWTPDELLAFLERGTAVEAPS